MVTAIIIGCGITAGALATRWIIRTYRAAKVYKGDIGGSELSRLYRGGFEQKMSTREACLILNVRENENINAIKKAHLKVMISNHPDRGGSPYLALKINEAKSILEGEDANKS